MSEEKKEVIVFDRVAKNLKFLRHQLRLSLQGLASIVEIDVIDLYQFEKESHTLNIKEDHRSLIDVANYFAVRLDVLVYSDIEGENLIDSSWFEQLKVEISLGIRADRKAFHNEVIGFVYSSQEELSKTELLKSMLRQMQQVTKLEDRYYNLRRDGLIGKIDFFEG